MQFSTYWVKLTVSNQGLANEENKITLSVGELKRLMGKAFDAGYENRKEVEKLCEEMRPKSALEKLFGDLRK